MASPPPKPIDRKKRRRFRLVAIALALAPFLIIELTLRWFCPVGSDSTYASDPYLEISGAEPLFEKDTESGFWVTNKNRLNFFRPTQFAINKSAGSQRIFVLGGSTTQGRPYAHETAFSTWLKLRLDARDPHQTHEVINAGGVSYASYRVSILLDEVLNYDPDVIVLYTGHNEFLEERTYAPFRETSQFTKFASRIGSNLHTVRWIRDQICEAPQNDRLSGEVDTILDHPGGLDSYQRDEAWRHHVHNHFAWTLEAMIQKIHAHGVKLVLCVPASDLVNTPPFKITLPGEEVSRFKMALTLAQRNDNETSKRIQSCRDALKIDPNHAGAHYLLGKLLLESGDISNAKIHLIAARDHDVCPLRATSTIISHVRRLAKNDEIDLVHTDVLLDQRNQRGERVPDGIPDLESFVDHVHPSISGHQIIGSAIADRLLPKTSEIASVYEKNAAKHLQTLDESYFLRGKQRLEGLKRWASGRAGELGIDEKEH